MIRNLNLVIQEVMTLIHYLSCNKHYAAWGAEKTPKLLDILDEHNVYATFFVTGFWLENYPDTAEKIAEHGHEIENHSYTHPHMSNLDKEQITNEVNKVHHQLK